MTQRHEVSKCYYKNGSDSYDLSYDLNLQFVEKKSLSAKQNKVKNNKMRYACNIYIIETL